MTDFAFLKAKLVFVVGGASGLGAAVARLAEQAGARVFVFDILPSDTGTYRRVDLLDESSIRAAVDEIGTQFDILISSAGLPPGSAPEHILQVNYLGQVAFLERLLANAQDGARIVTLASIGGREWRRNAGKIARLQSLSGLSAAKVFCRTHGIDGKAAYRLSKAALIQWTRQMASAHPANDATFLAVSPGPVNTDLFKRAAVNSPQATADLRAAAPRVPEPDEIAQAVIGFCRPEFSWLNGINIPLDGGADARFDAMGLNMDIVFQSETEEQR